MTSILYAELSGVYVPCMSCTTYENGRGVGAVTNLSILPVDAENSSECTDSTIATIAETGHSGELSTFETSKKTEWSV